MFNIYNIWKYNIYKLKNVYNHVFVLVDETSVRVFSQE